MRCLFVSLVLLSSQTAFSQNFPPSDDLPPVEVPKEKDDAPVGEQLKVQSGKPAPMPEVKPEKPLPVPDRAVQEKSLAEIKEVLKDEYAKLGKHELAIKLLTLGKGTTSDPTRRYVLLVEATRAAVAAGNGPLVLECIDAVAERYQGPNYIEIKTASLERTVPNVSKELSVAFVNCSLTMASQLVSQDTYPEAIRLTVAATTVATKYRHVDLIKRIKSSCPASDGTGMFGRLG